MFGLTLVLTAVADYPFPYLVDDHKCWYFKLMITLKLVISSCVQLTRYVFDEKVLTVVLNIISHETWICSVISQRPRYTYCMLCGFLCRITVAVALSVQWHVKSLEYIKCTFSVISTQLNVFPSVSVYFYSHMYNECLSTAVRSPHT